MLLYNIVQSVHQSRPSDDAERRYPYTEQNPTYYKKGNFGFNSQSCSPLRGGHWAYHDFF
jgi:hypothetical protein